MGLPPVPGDRHGGDEHLSWLGRSGLDLDNLPGMPRRIGKEARKKKLKIAAGLTNKKNRVTSGSMVLVLVLSKTE